MQGSRKGLRGEACRRYGELERSGRDVGKGELAIAAGHHLLIPRIFVQGIFACSGKLHTGSRDDCSALVDYRSADASGQRLTGRLLAG
jgi:hypothetical protein